MTVWVVTVNGYVESVHATREAAGQAIDAHKQAIRLNRGGGAIQWRPIGGRDDADLWSSAPGTSVARRAYEVA